MGKHDFSNQEKIIKETVLKEQESGLYNIKIDGIGIYHFIKRGLRSWILHCNGIEMSYSPPIVSNSEHRKNVLKSLWQLFVLLLRGKKYNTFIYSFRTDKINGIYMDKFTDPLIDYSDIGKSYIVFESDGNGAHNRPRAHADKVVFADAIDWLADILAHCKLKQKDSIIQRKWEELKHTIEKTFPNTDLSKTKYKYYITKGLYIVKIYRFIFRRLKIRFFISPARASFLYLIPAAKQENVKVFELQHGAIYGFSRIYAGRIDYDPLFMPDKFFTYGDFPDNRYDAFGLLREDYINIGWAYGLYLSSYNKEEVLHNESVDRVLFISDLIFPNQRELFIGHFIELAKKNPSIKFCYRRHPQEAITQSQREKLVSEKNIIIDDGSENIFSVIMKFDNVIGINSSGLYDALNLGKKVGKLRINGVCEPSFISKSDEQFFYLITDNQSFIEYIKAPMNSKPKKNVYSPFSAHVLNNELTLA